MSKLTSCWGLKLTLSQCSLDTTTTTTKVIDIIIMSLPWKPRFLNLPPTVFPVRLVVCSGLSHSSCCKSWLETIKHRPCFSFLQMEATLCQKPAGRSQTDLSSSAAASLNSCQTCHYTSVSSLDTLRGRGQHLQRPSCPQTSTHRLSFTPVRPTAPAKSLLCISSLLLLHLLQDQGYGPDSP